MSFKYQPPSITQRCNISISCHSPALTVSDNISHFQQSFQKPPKSLVMCENTSPRRCKQTYSMHHGGINDVIDDNTVYVVWHLNQRTSVTIVLIADTLMSTYSFVVPKNSVKLCQMPRSFVACMYNHEICCVVVVNCN